MPSFRLSAAALTLPAALWMLGVSASLAAAGPTDPAPATMQATTPNPNPNAASPERPAPRRLLISGHSLTDQPLPDMLAAIAKSQGLAWDWQRQSMWGTSIRDRTAGKPGSAAWSGYRLGMNRQGEGLDMLAELRSASAGAEPYDGLLITELHSLLGALVWNDSVRLLRHYHERFIEANPRGVTWLYESWLGLDDKADPRRWIAYEREASKVWGCVATRINTSLQAEGRADRIASLPAARALAALIERATQAPGVAGLGEAKVFDAATRRALVDRLVADDVHLTPLGVYYIALVSSAVMSGRSPVGAWHPADVEPVLAASLQREAEAFVAAWRAEPPPLDLAGCRSFLQRSFIGLYWGYVRDTVWLKDQGRAKASWNWLSHRVRWHWRFWRNNADNPFHFDPATDKAYWLPPP